MPRNDRPNDRQSDNDRRVTRVDKPAASPPTDRPMSRRTLAMSAAAFAVAGLGRAVTTTPSPWDSAVDSAYREYLFAERSLALANRAGSSDRERLMLWSHRTEARAYLVDVVLESVGVDLPPDPTDELAYSGLEPVAAVMVGSKCYSVIRTTGEEAGAIQHYGPLGVSTLRLIVTDLSSL